MMGLKARVVTPRHTVSLDDLVPADHFYRHLAGPIDVITTFRGPAGVSAEAGPARFP